MVVRFANISRVRVPGATNSLKPDFHSDSLGSAGLATLVYYTITVMSEWTK